MLNKSIQAKYLSLVNSYLTIKNKDLPFELIAMLFLRSFQTKNLPLSSLVNDYKDLVSIPLSSFNSFKISLIIS